MYKDVKNLIKHSSIYTFGNVISKFLGILLVPLYTTVISVELYGIYSILEITQQFLTGILSIGLPGALIRWLSLEKNQNKRGSLLFSVYVTTLSLSLLTILFIFVFKTGISKLFFKSSNYANCLVILSVIIGLRLVNNVGLSYIKFEEKSILFITISISRFFIQLLVTIYLVAILKVGIIGIFGGQLTGEFISFLFLAKYLISEIDIKFDYTETKKMLMYGFPLIFAGISNKILNIGDRYILGYLTNWAIVGIYSLGYKFANLVDTIFIKSFRTAFQPKAWKKLKQKNAGKFYSKMLTYYVFFIFWVALFISVYAKGIIHLFARDRSYWDASMIAPLAVFAISIRGMFSIVTMGINIKKKTKFFAYITTFSAVLNVLLNFGLIPLYGMIGAALATLISFLFMVMAGYFISYKLYPVKFEWLRIGKIILTIGITYFVSYTVNPLPIIARIVLKLILLLLYPIIIYFFGFYDSSEIVRIQGAWKKWRDPKKWIENIKDIKLQ